MVESHPLQIYFRVGWEYFWAVRGLKLKQAKTNLSAIGVTMKQWEALVEWLSDVLWEARWSVTGIEKERLFSWRLLPDLEEKVNSEKGLLLKKTKLNVLWNK